MSKESDSQIIQKPLQRHSGEPLTLCKAVFSRTNLATVIRWRDWKRRTTAVNLAHRLPLFAPEFSRTLDINQFHIFSVHIDMNTHNSHATNNQFPSATRKHPPPSPLCPRSSVSPHNRVLRLPVSTKITRFNHWPKTCFVIIRIADF